MQAEITNSGAQVWLGIVACLAFLLGKRIFRHVRRAASALTHRASDIGFSGLRVEPREHEIPTENLKYTKDRFAKRAHPAAAAVPVRSLHYRRAPFEYTTSPLNHTMERYTFGFWKADLECILTLETAQRKNLPQADFSVYRFPMEPDQFEVRGFPIRVDPMGARAPLTAYGGARSHGYHLDFTTFCVWAEERLKAVDVNEAGKDADTR